MGRNFPTPAPISEKAGLDSNIMTFRLGLCLDRAMAIVMPPIPAPMIAIDIGGVIVDMF